MDAAAPIGTVVTCVACHNEAAGRMTSVLFPSGLEITDLADEAVCMQCHQRRASTQTFDDAIAGVGVDADTTSEDLGFVNIHYYAAAASQYGALAMDGYQYEGKSYDVRYAHVEGFETCIECHHSHSLELDVEACSECHAGVAQVGDLRSVRSVGSTTDYDGDTSEGILREIEGLQEILLSAIRGCAGETGGVAIVYDVASYPYFSIDANENGEADPDEANYGNRYNTWTPRLLQAAYNYQYASKDPGAYSHNPLYILQVLYDALSDSGTQVEVDMTGMVRPGSE